MADPGLLPVLAGGIFGAVLCILALFWKINRPWDIIYRLIFLVFGLFLLVGTVGIANDFLAENALNQDKFSSAVGFAPNNDLLVTYYNASTGDLMAGISVDNGNTWNSTVIQKSAGDISAARTISLTSTVNSVYLLWITISIIIVLFIIEIILWYRNMVAEAEGKRSGKWFMEGKEP